MITSRARECVFCGAGGQDEVGAHGGACLCLVGCAGDRVDATVQQLRKTYGDARVKVGEGHVR